MDPRGPYLSASAAAALAAASAAATEASGRAVPAGSAASMRQLSLSGGGVGRTGPRMGGLDALLLVKQLHECLNLIPAEMKVEYARAQRAFAARSALGRRSADSSPAAASRTADMDESAGGDGSPSLLSFLESENWNASAAALKLVLYWKTRVELFGGDRAFLPLRIQSDPADLAVFRTGFFAPLPGAEDSGDCQQQQQQQQQQHPARHRVFYCDVSRLWANERLVLELGFERMLLSCLRCFFCVLDEAARAGRKCIILMHWCKSDQIRYLTSSAGNQKLVKERIEQVLNSCPILNDSSSFQVMVCQGSDWDSQDFFYQNTSQFDTGNSSNNGGANSTTASSSINRNIGTDVGAVQAAAIRALKVGANSRMEMARKLVTVLSPLISQMSSIPMSLGGTWTFEQGIFNTSTPPPAAIVPQPSFFQQLVSGGGGNGIIPGMALTSSERTSILMAQHQQLKRKDNTGGAVPGSVAQDGPRRKRREFVDKVVVERKPPPSPQTPVTTASWRGSFCAGKATNHVHVRGLQEFESALTLLPEQDRAALEEARRVIPDLAEKEAPPLRFLLFENYNAWAAARRLAAYWTARKRIFAERAFLPMNQTGEGTLTRDDVTILRSGYYLLLPNDEHGHPVIVGDPARRGNHARLPRLRLAFYMFSILSESEMAQREGAVIIAILQKQPHLDGAVRECSNLVLDTLPLRLHSLHIVQPPTTSKRGFVEKLVPMCLRLFERFIDKRACVHVAESREDLINKLGRHGLREVGLPESIGGKWSYENFHRWQELRMCYEWELPVVGARSADDLPFIPPYNAKARSELNDEEKVERKRRLNVLHSRRKRERSRVEKEVLGSQVSDMRQENERLKEENKRFEHLLKQAQELLENAGCAAPGYQGVVWMDNHDSNTAIASTEAVASTVASASAKMPSPSSQDDLPQDSDLEEDKDLEPPVTAPGASAKGAFLLEGVDIQALLSARSATEDLQRHIQRELLTSARGVPLLSDNGRAQTTCLNAPGAAANPAASATQHLERLPYLSVADALSAANSVPVKSARGAQQQQEQQQSPWSLRLSASTITNWSNGGNQFDHGDLSKSKKKYF